MTEILKLVAERNLPEIPENREEIKRILQEEIYGFMPPAPDEITFSEDKVIDTRFPARAVLRRMYAHVSIGERSFNIPFYTAFHTDGKKRPFFIHNNFRPNTPDIYMPVEEILDNDFDLLSLCYTDVTSDDGDFTTGLADIFIGSEPRKADTCGKIILWAWAAMRVMDYAQTCPNLDLENGGIIGHSRLGKTALVTAMFDTRFKFVFSNNAGCCGDAFVRGKSGEKIADITRAFPFWFCENLKKYAGHHEDMPFDQHFLIASIAPRYVYVASSSLDSWADPKTQYLTCAAASDYFEKRGVTGFVHPDRFPNLPESFHEGHIGYHIKDGDHFLSRRDWIEYMKYFKAHLND